MNKYQNTITYSTDSNESPRQRVLREAGEAIADRSGTYGNANERAAELFSAYLGVPLAERDVCILMGLMKIARLKQSPDHHDSWVDLAGYAALGGAVE